MGCGQKDYSMMITDRDIIIDQMESSELIRRLIPVYITLVDIRDNSRLTLDERKKISKYVSDIEEFTMSQIEKPEYCKAGRRDVFKEIQSRYPKAKVDLSYE